MVESLNHLIKIAPEYALMQRDRLQPLRIVRIKVLFEKMVEYRNWGVLSSLGNAASLDVSAGTSPGLSCLDYIYAL